MTYNLNYGLSGDAETLGAVGNAAADLVLLQETTQEWESAIRARYAGDYPHIAFRHCCRAGGLGVLSKYPFQELEYLEPPTGGWFPAWRLRVASPLGLVEVLNVHLRPQIGDSGPNLGGVMSGMVTTPPIRRHEVGTYLAHLPAGVPRLIAGDFNESENGGAVSGLDARGFRSALPEYSADETWHWNSSMGELSRRFDHVIYSPELDALSARVVSAGNSDHYPVVAVFELR